MTGDICPRSQRIDGPKHSWVFDGDDPYLICAFCDEMRDAHTGRVLRQASADSIPPLETHPDHKPILQPGTRVCVCGARDDDPIHATTDPTSPSETEAEISGLTQRDLWSTPETCTHANRAWTIGGPGDGEGYVWCPECRTNLSHGAEDNEPSATADPTPNPETDHG